MLLETKHKLALLTFLIMLVYTGFALSQGLDFITIISSFQSEDNAKNSVLTVDFRINEGFIYENSFKIELEKTTGFEIEKIEYPKSQNIFDKFRGENSKVYEGNIVFRIYFKSPLSNEEREKLKKIISITYEACSATTSFKPRTVSLVNVFDKNKSSPTELSIDKKGNNLDKKLQRGLIIALIAAFITGLISSLTPCVYPIIPIVVSVIGAQAGSNKLKGFKLSLIFALGLSVLYSSLGLLATKTGRVFGSVFQSSYLVIAVSVVFGLMGLSLLGLFEIKIPSFIQKRLSAKNTNKNGYTGTFLAGAVTGIVAVPCIGPFVISVITFTATQANIIKGFFIMFSFSMGLSLLFVVIGTFSSILASIPKPGTWMIILKKIFGLILFGVFLYYLSTVLPYSAFIIIFGLSLFLLALIFTGLENFSSEKIKLLHKRLSQFCAVGGVIILLGLAFTSSLPIDSGNKRIYSGEIPWIKSEMNALNLSKQNQKPVLIDFYADWCIGCKDLESKTFPDKIMTQ